MREAAAMTRTLVVMGVSGVGKTSVAAELVRRTRWAFVEGDDLHPEENRAKMAAGTPLDDDDRWPWLRRIAAWIGEQEAAGRDAVLTCSALKRSYRDLLRDGHPSVRFVHLLAPPELIKNRVDARRGHYSRASSTRSNPSPPRSPASASRPLTPPSMWPTRSCSASSMTAAAPAMRRVEDSRADYR
jgi:gluconokinase